MKGKKHSLDTQKVIEAWELEWNNYRINKTDKIYKVIDLLRNAVAFHYKDDFIKNNYESFKSEDDIIIGFTKNGKTATTRFSLFMNYVLSGINKIIGNEFSQENYLDYLNKAVLTNVIGKKCLIIEQLILEFIEDNMYLEDDVYNLNG